MRKIIMLLMALALPAGNCPAGVSAVGGLSRRHTAEPGGRYDGVILVRNRGDTEREVVVYQTDFRRNHEGRRTYSEPGRLARSNAGWVTLSPERFIIPPGSSEQVYYTVSVPEDENLRGTYWSMVMVEPIDTPDPETVGAEETKVSVGIRVTGRTGIHMITNIGETGERDIRIMDRTLVQDDEGRVFLQMDIENTGERHISARIWTELYNDEGMNVGRFGAERTRMGLLPGNSSRQRINLTHVPPGSYQALVIIDDDSEEVFGAQLSFNLQEAEGTEAGGD